MIGNGHNMGYRRNFKVNVRLKHWVKKDIW